MTRPRIFVTQPVANSALERLRKVAELDFNPDAVHIATKDELLAAVRTHDILFCLLHDRVDGDVIAAISKASRWAARCWGSSAAVGVSAGRSRGARGVSG